MPARAPISGSIEAEEQADRAGDLEHADAAIHAVVEKPTSGSLPHRLHGHDFGAAQADENQGEQHREDGGRDNIMTWPPVGIRGRSGRGSP